MMELNRTWLLQRLKKSRYNPDSKSPLAKAHRVFGGGMLGLNEKQWDLLDPIFEIDYMGAAEFEFGTIPKCLKDMWSGLCTLMGVEHGEDKAA